LISLRHNLPSGAAHSPRRTPAGRRRVTGYRSVMMRRWYLTLCAVTTGWGTIPVLAREVPLPASLLVAGRLWTASVCLAAIVWWRRRASRKAQASTAHAGSRAQASGDPALFSIRPILCLTVGAVLAFHWLALFAAYKRAPAGTVILIVYLAPIGVAILAPVLIGERFGRHTAFALAVATAGFALLAAPTVRAAGATGLAYSLVAAVLFVFLIVLSKPLASAYGGTQLALMEMTVAGLILIPVVAAAHWPAPDRSWLWLVVLGLVHTAIGTGLYLAALARLPATHVGILGYLEPVGVVICAWIFLGQRPAFETVFGGIIVTAAGIGLVIGSRSGNSTVKPLAAGVPADNGPVGDSAQYGRTRDAG
jgi:drug/metabolite transporter (DMT)-like permease